MRFRSENADNNAPVGELKGLLREPVFVPQTKNIDEQFDVDYQGYHFKILSVENKMIQSVLLTKLPEQTAEETN